MTRLLIDILSPLLGLAGIVGAGWLAARTTRATTLPAQDTALKAAADIAAATTDRLDAMVGRLEAEVQRLKAAHVAEIQELRAENAAALEQIRGEAIQSARAMRSSVRALLTIVLGYRDGTIPPVTAAHAEAIEKAHRLLEEEP